MDVALWCYKWTDGMGLDITGWGEVESTFRCLTISWYIPGSVELLKKKSCIELTHHMQKVSLYNFQGKENQYFAGSLLEKSL